MKKPRKRVVKAGLTGEPVSMECHSFRGEMPGVWFGDFFFSSPVAIIDMAEFLHEASQWLAATQAKKRLKAAK